MCSVIRIIVLTLSAKVQEKTGRQEKAINNAVAHRPVLGLDTIDRRVGGEKAISSFFPY
jgi:hypothetical protein